MYSWHRSRQDASSSDELRSFARSFVRRSHPRVLSRSASAGGGSVGGDRIPIKLPSRYGIVTRSSEVLVEFDVEGEKLSCGSCMVAELVAGFCRWSGIPCATWWAPPPTRGWIKVMHRACVRNQHLASRTFETLLPRFDCMQLGIWVSSISGKS